MNNVSVETLEKLREDMVGRRYRHFKGRTYMENIRQIHLTQDLQKDEMSALMRLQEEWINGMCKEM